MNDQSDLKTQLRKRICEQLTELDSVQRHSLSIAACRRVAELEVFSHALTVMFYMPISGEVDLTPLALSAFEQGKSVCVPRVDWNRHVMSPVEVNSFDDEDMETDERGIRTPVTGRPVPIREIDLVIVPGLAFDTHGRRLGRGGGFYDRFLSTLRGRTTTVGLVFDQQIAAIVPVDPHDVSVDLVVTDRRMSRRGRLIPC